MNKLIIAALVIFQSVSSAMAQGNKEADGLLEEMLESKGIVGITAGYAKGSTIKWSNSAGYSCLDAEILFTDSTLTRAASLAKCMTAVAVMQLVEQGLIDLDEPVQTYLPDFPQESKAAITTRQLLSHTSGISQYQSAKEIENTIHYNSLKDAMDVFKNRPLLFEPGTDFFYTSYGYVVLGRLIEEVTTVGYEEYMQLNIWGKAEMYHTGIEKIGETYSNKSCLYHKERQKSKLAKQNDLSNRIPAGGFFTTLNDMFQFGNALLEGKLINEDTFQQMIQNQFELKEGNPYGFGWFLYGPKPNESVVIGHSGEQTGCASQLMIIPKSKTVVVVLSNTSGTWKDVVTFSSELIRISELNEN